MPKILGFYAEIISVKYLKIENKIKQNKDFEPEIYICNANIKELGRGLAKSHQYHQVQFQLNRQDFDDKILEKGDRVQIMDNATWYPQGKMEYKTYDAKKIEKYDKSQLFIDEKGRTYAKTTAYPYIIKVKPEQFKVTTKWYDQNYCCIKSSRVKLPLDSKKQFQTENEFNFFLDEEEYQKLCNYHGCTAFVVAYHCGNKFDEKEMSVVLVKDNSSGNYLLSLKKFEEKE